MISNSELDQIQMNFIIGPGRSGTTLLMMLLNASDQCVATPEIKHTLYFYNKFKNITCSNDELQEMYLMYFQLFKKSSTNPLYSIDLDKIKGVFDSKLQQNYGQLNKRIHIALHQKEPTALKSIIDKNNLYTFHVEKLIKLYPKATFRVLIRDYRAFVASNLESQHKFKENKSIAFYSFVWKAYAEKIHSLQSKYPTKISITTYENLVEKPKEVVPEIFNSFGIDYDASVFDYRMEIEEKVMRYNQSEHPDPRISKKISDLSKPITNSRINSWKEKLSPSSIKIIEAICGDQGEKWGYLPINKQGKVSIFGVKMMHLFSMVKVTLYFKLNSMRLHHYLNVERRAKHNTKNQYFK
jgi:hypothetical protein